MGKRRFNHNVLLAVISSIFLLSTVCGSKTIKIKLVDYEQQQAQLKSYEREILRLNGLLSEKKANYDVEISRQNEMIGRYKADNDNLRLENNGLKTEASSCRTKLNDILLSPQVELSTKLDASKKELEYKSEASAVLLDETKRSYYYKGMLEYIQGLEVTSSPRVVSGIFYNDYYMQFVVRHKGKIYVNFEVQTHHKETGFGNIIVAGIETLATLASRVPFH